MNLKLTLATIASLTFLPAVESVSPFVISDDRVRSLDISPVLGRGYSIMTNTYQSTCLIVDQTTVPSFNYDYFYTDFTESSDSEATLGGKISGSLSYGFVSGEASVESSATAKVASQSHMIATTMKIERYYSSVREEVSPLASDAYTLLDTQDYVGFFKACGPNYIRSIRRAQEVTAVFKFTSSSREVAAEFSASLAVSGAGKKVEGSSSGKSKFNSVNSSLSILIQGFGMGLSQEGAGTLVATTLEEFQGVMKFAFNSMTKSEGAHNIGMVYGMEVVPWVNNLAFNVASKLGEEDVIINLPKSLIPKKLDSGVCKARAHKIDKYDYCCEAEDRFIPTLYRYFRTTTTEEGDADSESACEVNGVQDCICKPRRELDKSLVRDNMVNNGEFVARLDNALRYRLAQLGQLEKCVSAVNAIPERLLYRQIKSQDSVKYDKEIEFKVRVVDLKLALDPISDYGMVKHLGYELDEWIEKYYSPCLSALYGQNVGTTPGTDPQYFMAYPWYTHDECMKLSCLTVNMAWNRVNSSGGCVASIVAQTAPSGSASLSTGTKFIDSNCAKSSEEPAPGYPVACKHTSDKLDIYYRKAATCWSGVNVQTAGKVVVGPSLDYLVNHFCLPTVTAVTDETGKSAIDALMLASGNGECSKNAPTVA